MHTRKLFVCAGCMIAVAASLCVAVSARKPGDFSLGLTYVGPWKDGHVVFSASLTNMSPAGAILDGIQFQYTDNSGKIVSCHAIPAGWHHEMQSKETVTTHFTVPASTKKIR